MAYSKLFSSIVSSSIWTEPDPVRILFITLLAMSDRQGVVYGSKGGLARIACIAPESIDIAFGRLLEPDPDSSDLGRNPENEGRRIEDFPGGFRIINYEYYRNIRNEDDRKEQNREAQRRYTQKKRGETEISRRSARSADSASSEISAHAEAEAEAEVIQENSDDDVGVLGNGGTGRGNGPEEEFGV